MDFQWLWWMSGDWQLKACHHWLSQNCWIWACRWGQCGGIVSVPHGEPQQSKSSEAGERTKWWWWILQCEGLSTKQLTEFLKHSDTVIDITDDNTNRERRAKVTRVIQSAVACFKECYNERQKAICQLSCRHLFVRVGTGQSSGSARDLVVPHTDQHLLESSD